MPPFYNKRKGFTLIEILVVIGILAILFIITIIALNPQRNFTAAADTRRKSDLAELHKSLMQYFVDHKSFPQDSDWSASACITPIPSPFAPYMPFQPCDPQTNNPYVYQALNATCQPCTTAQCSGYRLLTELGNTQDKAIISAGCSPTTGCGVIGPNGENLNYGVSSGCTIVATPMPQTPTPTSSIPSLSPTPTVTGILSPTPTITAGPSMTPTITPTIPITPLPGFTPNPSFDSQRIDDLYTIALGLEKYYFINRQYPTCGGTWKNVDCLNIFLSSYLINGQVPIDPENGDPYIYFAYSSGQSPNDRYCVSAHLGDAASHQSEINCPIGEPLPIYTYRFRERSEIIYRPSGNPLTELEKESRDSQRISDIDYFKNILEQYKIDNGHYPNCWATELTWVSTGAGNFFCGGQLTSYGSNFNFDPGGDFSYNIIQWNPDQNGFFQNYCFASFMDKGNNTNCNLGCPINNYNSNYCYFTPNP